MQITMNTKILAMAVALMACSLFADTYLYWMVDAPAGFDFLYATVKQDNKTLSNQGYSGGELGTMVANSNLEEGGETGLTTPNVYAYGIKDGYVGSTFLFELFNESNERVGYSAVTGSALGNSIGGTMSQTSLYKVTNVIPEPTSTLLMLLGFAGLALRRRSRRA